MIEIIYKDIEYIIKIVKFSFKVYRKEEGSTYEEGVLFSGKFNDRIFDLNIERIDYANKEFILLVEDELKKFFKAQVEEAKEGEGSWNKKTKKENQKTKKDIEGGVNKIILKIKNNKNSLSLEDLFNIFFDTLVENITDEDIKREVAFSRNKIKIVVDKINNQIK